jgi:hypothetical protein
MALREQVYQSLDNAVANGYVENFEQTGKSIYDVDPTVLAADTLDCDADLDDFAIEDLLPHVIAWQKERRPR